MSIKKIMTILALALILYPVHSFAGEVDLPKTGQTTCYDANGGVIGCTGTGQDGDIQAGVNWPSPRFTDNGDGTMTDNLTGLIWLKNADCGGGMDWEDAIGFSNNLSSGQCGLSDASIAGDWHLPNIVELESLVNAEEPIPSTWLDGQGFSNLQSSIYWSSTTYAFLTDNAWGIDLGDSNDGSVDDRNKSSAAFVWPVRAGQSQRAPTWQTGQTTSYAAGDDGDLEHGIAWPSPRFTDNGDGTITDCLTGLIWLQNADCSGAVAWESAITYCKNLSSGSCGLSDGSGEGEWRLPNRKELMSLIDYEKYNAALPSGHPFSNVQPSFYRSSTTSASDTERAWSVYLFSGGMYQSHKSWKDHVWPVRDSRIIWTFQVDDELGSAAIGPDGTIYVSDSQGVLYALNPTDGSQQWTFPLGGEALTFAVGRNGTIYIGTDAHFYAVNSDGSLKWTFGTAGPFNPPAIGKNGTIYTGSNGKLYAVNPDGTQKWVLEVPGVNFSFISIASNGMLYAGALQTGGTGGLYAVSPNGTPSWFFNTTGDVFAPAIGSDGAIYVGSSLMLHAINPNGTERWAFSADAGVYSPSIAKDGTIYAGTESGRVYAVNPDGTQKWSYQAQGEVAGPPTVGADGVIYFGAEEGKFYAVNPDGTQKWFYQTAGPIFFTPPAMDADGTVYVSAGEADAILYALKTSSSGLATSPWPMGLHDAMHSGAQNRKGLVFLPVLLNE